MALALHYRRQSNDFFFHKELNNAENSFLVQSDRNAWWRYASKGTKSPIHQKCEDFATV